MVNTRGKQKTASSSITIKASESAENALAEGLTSHAPTINMDEPNADGQYEDKVELPVEEAKHEGNEVPGKDESGEVAKVVDNDEHITEINTDGVESEPNSSEDDESDDQEDLMWDEEEHSEEDDEENVGDEDEASMEDAEKDDDEDEVSMEVASEKEAHGEDEVSRQKMDAEVAEGDERRPKAKEDEVKSKEDSKEVKEHNKDKVEAGLKNDKNSNETIKKKLRVGTSKKLDSKSKPDSSRKRKGKKRVESMGMIFICSSKTKDDCYQYRVLGLPESKKDIVEKIYTGMRLFLYDVDLKLMYGIYKAAGPGGYNLEPKAFKSQFPAQVRFAVLDDCLPLPEEKFKKVIKENYFTNTKFDGQLKAQQVKKLCKLFIVSSKGRRSKKLRRPHKAENFPIVCQERDRRRRVGGEERHLALRDEEPRYRERPPKRPRKAVVSPPRHQPPLAPLPSAVPSYGYGRTFDVDAYSRGQYPYRDRRDPLLIIRRDPYIDRRDRYPERDYPYRDPYVERHESYRDGRDIYSRGRDPYVDGRASFIERRDAYRDGRDSDVGFRSSYRDGRDAYLERQDPYMYSEAYSICRRDLLSDGHDAYREGEGGEYRISFRREEELHYPYGLETRNRHDNGSRDSYVSNSQRPSYADPIYSAEYPSRAGLAREYHL